MLSYTCRTCASITEATKLTDMSQNLLENDPIIILDALRELCASFGISKLKIFPQQICDKCLMELKNAFFFLKSCKRSEALLKVILSDRITIAEDSCLEVESKIEENTNAKPTKVKTETSQIVVVLQNPQAELDDDLVVIEKEECTEIQKLDESDGYSNVQSDEDYIAEEVLEEYYAQPEEDGSTNGLVNFEKARAEIFSCHQCLFITDIKYEFNMHIKDHQFEYNQSNELEINEENLAIDDNLVSTTTETIWATSSKSKSPSCEKLRMRGFYRTYTNNKKFFCDICSKDFKRKNVLRMHMNVHINYRPFQCKICGKGFKTKSNLNIHLTIHFGKPHLCSECGKRYSTAADLAAHFRRHTGEKPFKCDQCSATFVQKSYLNAHLESHLTEKLQQCRICDRKYKTKACLRLHMFKHNGYPFSCSMCNKNFCKKYLYDKHMKTTHKPLSSIVFEEVTIPGNAEMVETNEEDMSVIEYLDDQ